jgi:UDP-N-acetylmuramoyl-tripeptide--D-alanyl-D-alanine ligase
VVTRTAGGPAIIDDTYNANLGGALKALHTARDVVSPDGTVWVVTPGMVELGTVQYARNMTFGQAVTADGAAQLVVTNRINRKALVAGGRAGARNNPAAAVTVMPNRDAAVAFVGERAKPGDVVLFENDLPESYP